MKAVNLQQLLQQAGLADVAKCFASDLTIVGIADDSRAVKPGYLFAAVAGYGEHGLVHAQAAIDAGAVAVLWQPEPGLESPALSVASAAVPDLLLHLSKIAACFYQQPAAAMRCIGVTGTNGKSSFVHLYAQGSARRCAQLGTLGYGFNGALQKPSHTTPLAIRVQALLAELNADNAEEVAMEVSSHGLQQGRVAAVPFETAVFTNLSRDHLDYHGDMASYAAVKATLFSWAGLRHAVVNVDDAFAEQLLALIPATVNVIAYSLDADALSRGPNLTALRPAGSSALQWLVASELTCLPAGIELAVDGSWGTAKISSALLGRFNASNLLAVLGALLAGAADLQQSCQRLSVADAVTGRMQQVAEPSADIQVVVDYAHTPAALEAALTALRAHCQQRLICLFGCGGDRDKGKRAEMAAVAEQTADQLILTSDNPRSEAPEAILADIRAGLTAPALQEIIDRRDAIRWAVAHCNAGDVLLIAGKGHEDYQEINGQRLPFSDQQEASSALLERAA